MEKALETLPMIVLAFGFGLTLGLIVGVPAFPVALGAVGSEIAMQTLK